MNVVAPSSFMRACRDVDMARLLEAFVFDGQAPIEPPHMLIKGLLPSDGVAMIGGQSGAGKTFIAIHKGVCLASGRPFFGREILERVGVAYVAAEGRNMIAARIAAAKHSAEIEGNIPFAWIDSVPTFTKPEGVKLFIDQLQALDEKFRREFEARLGAVFIDTVSASFSMKDEDDNAEAAAVCRTMREIGNAAGVLMLPVHHFGKTAEAGLRGASAWKANADMVLAVLADIDPLTGKAKDRELAISKARDGEQGPIAPFDLEFVELAKDEAGEPFGTCSVSPNLGGKSRFDKKAPRMARADRAMRDAIAEALDSWGRLIQVRPDGPTVTATAMSDVRAEFDKRYATGEGDKEKAADAKRKAFKRALEKMAVSEFPVSEIDAKEWIWRA